MPVAYPVNLPIPLITPYSFQDNRRYSKIEVETGPPRFELKTTHGPTFFNAVWLLDSIDFQVFEGWYKYNLNFGAETFNLTLKVGEGLIVHEVFFNQPYSSSLVDKKWRVTSKLISTKKVTLPPSTAYSQMVLSDNPTGYWKVDKTSGLIAFDSSGNGFHGYYSSDASTMTTTSLLSSGEGAAANNFGLITIPHDPAFFLLDNDFTIEIIVTTPSFVASGTIISKWSTVNGFFQAWTLAYDVIDKLSFFIRDDAQVNLFSFSSDDPLPKSSVNIIHIRRKDDVIEMFINAALQTEALSFSGLINTLEPQPIVIGAVEPDNFNWNGAIDEAALYVGQALSQETITARKNEALNG